MKISGGKEEIPNNESFSSSPGSEKFDRFVGL
jgi:hypothetical protein